MKRLPSEFQDLEEQYEDWILATHGERVMRRAVTSTEHQRELYNTILPRFHDIVHFIDNRPLDQWTQPVRDLWYLTASFIEIAIALETYGSHKDILGSPYLIQMLSDNTNLDELSQEQRRTLASS